MQLIRNSIDLSAYMHGSEEEHAVLPASSWVDDVIDHFHAPAEAPKPKLPWLKTHADFEFREGEVTLWGGINGHGKSQMVGHAMLGLIKQGETVCIASLEMNPKLTMSRMTRQAYGANNPPRDYIRQFGAWTDDKLWIYDHMGSTNPKKMLAVIRYARDKFGVKHFVVDNLMKVVAGEDDYNAQKDFVDSLTTIAHDTGVHIHLVLHMKKGKSESDVPGKFDIKGSGAITDLVENVFIVWRNKAKEESLCGGPESEMTGPDAPDALLILTKQRNGEKEGRYGFWFDHSSMQYLESRLDNPPMTKVTREVYADEIEF